MTTLAGGVIEVEIGDQNRRDQIGAMTNAMEVFKESMISGRRLTSEIAHLAHHDALTDLPNRVLFYEKLNMRSAMLAEVCFWRCIFSTWTSSRQ